MQESGARLRAILGQLPVVDLPQRVLNVGCGAYPSARLLREMWPGWALYGVDRDWAALRYAQIGEGKLRLWQADAQHSGLVSDTHFGLVLVRHPDLYRQRAAWQTIIPALPTLLAGGGYLLITVHAPEEIDLIGTLSLPPLFPLDDHTLPAVNLAGHDRFVRVYQASPKK